MTSVRPNLQKNVFSIISEIIDQTEKFSDVIHNISEEAVCSIGVIIINTIRAIYYKADLLRQEEKKEIINAKVIRNAIKIVLPSKSVKHFSKFKEHSEYLNNCLSFIKVILKNHKFTSKRTKKAVFYSAFAIRQLITNILAYSYKDMIKECDNGITNNNIAHAFENNDLALFMKRLCSISENFENNIIRTSDEKKTLEESKMDESENTAEKKSSPNHLNEKKI